MDTMPNDLEGALTIIENAENSLENTLLSYPNLSQGIISLGGAFAISCNAMIKQEQSRIVSARGGYASENMEPQAVLNVARDIELLQEQGIEHFANLDLAHPFDPENANLCMQLIIGGNLNEQSVHLTTNYYEAAIRMAAQEGKRLDSFLVYINARLGKLPLTRLATLQSKYQTEAGGKTQPTLRYQVLMAPTSHLNIMTKVISQLSKFSPSVKNVPKYDDNDPQANFENMLNTLGTFFEV